MSITFSPDELSQFFGARSRENVTAEAAIKALEARRVTGTLTCRLSSVRAVCDSVAQKAGHKLSDLTSPDLADLLAKGFGRNK